MAARATYDQALARKLLVDEHKTATETARLLTLDNYRHGIQTEVKRTTVQAYKNKLVPPKPWGQLPPMQQLGDENLYITTLVRFFMRRKRGDTLSAHDASRLDILLEELETLGAVLAYSRKIRFAGQEGPWFIMRRDPKRDDPDNILIDSGRLAEYERSAGS